MTALLKVLFLLTYASVQNSAPVMLEPQIIEVDEGIEMKQGAGLHAQGAGIELNAEEFKMLENGEIPERLREAMLEEKDEAGVQEK